MLRSRELITNKSRDAEWPYCKFVKVRVRFDVKKRVRNFRLGIFSAEMISNCNAVSKTPGIRMGKKNRNRKFRKISQDG